MLPWNLAVFLGIVVAFHASELALVAAFNREQLSWESALLSGPYVAMLAFALGEFWIERELHAPWSGAAPVVAIGLALVVIGEVVRKTAMLTARRAFTHAIARARRTGHALVSHGIYRHVRHPGYLGWFLWAVGAQLVLAAPLAAVVAAVTAWRFFAARIPDEEQQLVRLFPDDYAAYRARTPTWLPFIT